MTISILTPAYKAENYIGRAVRSVLAQTHQDWEMIIIADDKQDYQSILSAQGIRDERLRFTGTGGIGTGPSRARNIGLDCASYSIVGNLDADDEYSEDFLTNVLPTVRQYGATCTPTRMRDEKTGEELFRQKDKPNHALLVARDILESGFATFAHIVFDTQRTFARWPEAIHCAEDVFFWFLLLDDLPAIAYAAKPHYTYYYRDGSLSHPDNDKTQKLFARRAEVIHLLETGVLSIRNQEHATLFKRWLSISNELEHLFNFQLVAIDVYLSEFRKRLEAIIADGN